jgi:hypothetical protein
MGWYFGYLLGAASRAGERERGFEEGLAEAQRRIRGPEPDPAPPEGPATRLTFGAPDHWTDAASAILLGMTFLAGGWWIGDKLREAFADVPTGPDGGFLALMPQLAALIPIVGLVAGILTMVAPWLHDVPVAPTEA